MSRFACCSSATLRTNQYAVTNAVSAAAMAASTQPTPPRPWPTSASASHHQGQPEALLGVPLL
eukprot:6971943-Heterocapsa_arctica.AAC.1